MISEPVSIEEIKALARGHFFSKGATQFFNSRSSIDAWPVEDGYLFWTSEKDGTKPRRYTVRFLKSSDGGVRTVSDFQQFPTSRAARAFIARAIVQWTVD